MKNQLLVLTMLKRPVTSCRVCGKKDTETDRYGRCHGCYKAKLATDMGVRYGQLVTRPDFKDLEQWEAFTKASPNHPNGEEMKTCPICGTEFQKWGNKMYCSRECNCKAQHRKQKERERLVGQGDITRERIGDTVVCGVCHKQFIRQYNKQRYCSPVCSAIMEKALKQNRGHIKQCEMCGADFLAKCKTSRFCGKSCAGRAKARKKAAD